MENTRVVSNPRASAADVDFVRDELSPFNVAATGDSAYSPLAIFLRDERDAILGGPGRRAPACLGGWLSLSLLWVAKPPCGKGYGRKREIPQPTGRR